MSDPIRMSEGQFSRAKKLIRRLCANYDHGNCLRLDDGWDPCPCPQLISTSLLCRYFRSAVLPADLELWAEIIGDTVKKRCIICGRQIYRSSNAVKYCTDCAARERRKRDAERKRNCRLRVRKLGL